MESLPGVEIRRAATEKRRGLRGRGSGATVERKPESGAEPDDDGYENDVEDRRFPVFRNSSSRRV